jgi:hypothetical protein
MKIMKYVFPIILILITLYSCHWQSEIIAVKNTTSDSLLIAKLPNEIMTDSILYGERFDEDFMGTGVYSIALPNKIPKRSPDSEKVFLYFFHLDSLNKYQQRKQVKGIVKKSLLKKVIIQLNMVKNPLDTVYVDNSTIQ